MKKGLLICTHCGLPLKYIRPYSGGGRLAEYQCKNGHTALLRRIKK
jgi:hypothetical protein